jgi:hypothetical protein
LIHQDSVPMCQEAIRQGWLPHPDITISWDMIKHERYQVFCWYMQQPDLRQQFIDYANEKRPVSFTISVRRSSRS